MEAALNRKQERRPVHRDAGYFSPAALPAAYCGLAMVNNKGCSTTPSPPAQHPGMLYSAPSQPQQVFLGFVTTGHTSKPAYGPPGANFDWLGNVYIERSDGIKEWIGPYRGYYGGTKNPNQMLEEDCCY